GDGSPLFAAENVTNPRALADKLVAHSDPVSQFLWDRFTADSQEVLGSADSTEDDLRAALLLEFNRVISSPVSVYDVDRFANIPVLQDEKDQLALSPAGNDLIRVNREM